MDANVVLLSMLATVFVVVGAHHLLVFMRNTGAREHLWFGITSLAAAGSALVDFVASRPAPASGTFTPQQLSTSFAMVWLVAATWFSVEYAAGDRRRRRAALLATLLFVAVCSGDLVLATAGHLAFPASIQPLLRLLATLALAIMAWLVFDGVLRLWSSARRLRSATMAALGILLCAVALLRVLPGPGMAELSSPVLYAFLVVVLMMTYELARSAAEDEALLQRQRRELAQASRLSIVGELTAAIAHEINQPLGAILSNADAGEILLEDPDPSLDEIRKILGDIRRDGLRASDVIRHVRTLVKKRELELERLDANVVVADVIALLESESRRRRILVTSTPSQRPAYVRGDRTLLVQVLINLVMNAMDAEEATATADNAPVTHAPILLGVSTTRHGEIELRIVDTGQGIPPEHLDHLFDSFYTSKPHGMGLGLSIARSIVEAHGGRIRAENNRDAGARFEITLPPYD